MSEKASETKLLSPGKDDNTPKNDVVMDLGKDLVDDGDGPPSGSSSPLIAAMSTVNLVVGVGILYLPNTFIQCGIIPAILISAMVAYFSWYTSQLIVRIGMKLKKYSYEEICQVVLGDFGYVTLAASCVLFNWGGCLCYMMTLKSMLCTVLARYLAKSTWVCANMSVLTSPEFFALILCLPPLWGLSLLKDLSALSFASIVKAVVVTLTVITIFITSQTAAVQDTLEFTKWKHTQVNEFFKDVTDGGMVTGTKDPIYAGLVNDYKTELDINAQAHKDDPTTFSAKQWEQSKMAAAWNLVKAVDDYDFHEKSGKKTSNKKVREALRSIVNRENPKPMKREYDEKTGLPKGPEAAMGHSLNQPKGLWNRLSYASPYLFCSQFFTKLGTICFAFVFHDSIFSVYKTLPAGPADAPVSLWRRTSTYFMLIAFVIQVLFAMIIGLTFGTSTPDNVLTSSYDEGAVFPADNVFSQIIQIAFSIVLLLTYPACIVICREFVESIIVLYRPRPDGSKEVSRFWQLIIASILVALTVPFLFFPEAGEVADQVLDFVGGLACGYMAFVLPSILFWQVYGRTPAKGENRSMTDRILPYIVLALGIYTCLVAPVFTIMGWCGNGWHMPHPPQNVHTEL